MVSSEVRIGTPALATRGFDLDGFREVADIISLALRPDTHDAGLAALRDRVDVLARRFSPLPGADVGRTVTTPHTPPGAHLPEHPDFLWRTPEPKKTYDVVIVGGGGHGLATAHYLAKNHGITRRKHGTQHQPCRPRRPP